MKQVTCEGRQESLGAPGRNRAQEPLRESEERYRFLTENMLDLVWIVGLDLRTTYVSPSVEKVLGFTPEERRRQSIEEAVTPDSLRDIQKGLAEELQRDREAGTDPDRSVAIDVEYYRKDGSTVWMENRVQAIRDAEKNVSGLFGISRDITERKRAETELERRSRERRMLLDTIPVQVWYLTDPDTYGALNMAHADFLGRHPRELAHKRLEEVLRPEVAAVCRRSNIRVYETRRPVHTEEWLPNAAGEKRLIAITKTPKLDAQGNVEYVVCAGVDMTDQRRMETALRESEARFRHIFEFSPVGTELYDRNGRLIFANPACLEIFGVKDVQDVLSFRLLEDPNLDEALKQRLHGGETVQYEAPFDFDKVRRAGLYPTSKEGIIHLHVIITPIRQQENDVPTGYLALVSDITEQKRREEEIRQIQKTESLGRMAGAIAHHFNNQLQGVMGNLELAMSDMSQGVSDLKRLNEAMKATRKAAEVSLLMLTYLGQTVHKPENRDLSEICRLVLPMIKAGMPKNVRLETDLPSPGPAIHADANQMQQVLTNLVTNAWEAMGDEGGTIHLAVKAPTSADISATHRFPADWQPQDRAYACLEVRDDGPGVPEQEIENLFDPFFSTKFTGRGLGLSVVLGIVRAHGGCIAVESRYGARSREQGGGSRGQMTETLGASLREDLAGSVFRVFLPLMEGEVSRPDKKGARPGHAPQKGGTVLLVEDTGQVRELGARMLQHLGWKVLAAEDGVEGVQMFRKHQDEVAFVLSDLTMPGMDGWATIAALREIDPTIPIILASGYDEASVLSGDHPQRPQAFLGKPYSLEDLRAAIVRVRGDKE